VKSRGARKWKRWRDGCKRRRTPIIGRRLIYSAPYCFRMAVALSPWPANLDVEAALSIYHWLSQRREAVDDHRLPLLEQANGTSWQWLPLVGVDFPLHTYAQRSPLIA
jgi:hypothetical protein